MILIVTKIGGIAEFARITVIARITESASTNKTTHLVTKGYYAATSYALVGG